MSEEIKRVRPKREPTQEYRDSIEAHIERTRHSIEVMEKSEWIAGRGVIGLIFEQILKTLEKIELDIYGPK